MITPKASIQGSLKPRKSSEGKPHRGHCIKSSRVNTLKTTPIRVRILTEKRFDWIKQTWPMGRIMGKVHLCDTCGAKVCKICVNFVSSTSLQRNHSQANFLTMGLGIKILVMSDSKPCALLFRMLTAVRHYD